MSITGHLVPARPGSSMIQTAARYPVVVLMVFGVIAMSIFDDNFLSVRNAENIGKQASFLFTLALAQTVVLIGRQIDLSMGNLVSLISVVTAMTMVGAIAADWPVGAAVVLAIVAALVTGVASSGLLAIVSGLLGASSFIVSLGLMQIAYGVAAIISGGRPVSNLPESFSVLFNTGTFLSVPAPVLIAAVAGATVHFVLTFTVFGRLLYMTGSNPRAVYVGGHDPRRIVATAFLIAGVLVALSTLLLTARTGSGEPSLGANLLLQAMAAAVIGGVSLGGGRGTVLNALVGALTITVISNILNFLQVSGYLQMIILGAIIVIAPWLEQKAVET